MENENGLVTVIIPVYNADKYLECCIGSIVKQTYRELEILLINDGSKDQSLEVCKNQSKLDKRVKCFDKNHTGVSDTRNFGIRVAQGKFITFVDADDYLEKNYIKLLVEALKTESGGVFGFHSYDYFGKIMERKPRISAGGYTYDDLKDNLIDDGTLTGILFGSVCGGLYLREIIRKNNLLFEENVRKNEDGVFNLKYIYYAKKINVVEQFGYIYRQWKNKYKTVDGELNAATNAIEKFYRYAEKGYVSSPEFQRQLKRRKISVVFWEIMNEAQAGHLTFHMYKYVKGKMSGLSKKDFETINYERISVEKRMLCVLMQYRMALFFIFGIKIFYNTLKKIRKR